MDKNGIPHNPAGQLRMIIHVDLPCRANGGGGNLGISHRYSEQGTLAVLSQLEKTGHNSGPRK